MGAFMEEIAVAIIAAAAVIISQIIISAKQSKISELKRESERNLFNQEIEHKFKLMKKDIEYKFELMENGTGEVKGEITRLSEKQDKHNSLIERMTIVEQSIKSFHHRLDEIKKEI